VNTEGPYSERDVAKATNLAAFLGWSVFTVLTSILVGPIALPFALVLGLPIAFGTCWILGAPIIRRLMTRSVSWDKAALGGAIISAGMVVLSVIVGRIRGYRQSIDPTSSSQLGGGDFIREVDGILTAYGWMKLGEQGVMFVFLGIAIALIVRAVVGSGRV
jgi:hypothetical protein